MSRYQVSVLAAVVAVLLCPTATPAGDAGSLRFEKTIDVTPGASVALDAQVGPVRVSSVRLTTAGGESGSLLGKIRRSGDPDTSSSVRANFAAENPQDEEWVVTFTIELLDKKGVIIDRFSRNAALEGEAKTVELDHGLLTYVVPFIARARVILEARLD